MLNETRFAVKLARGSGKILINNLNKVKSVREKSPRNLVTDIDLASEKLIISSIKKEYPAHKVLSEEAGEIDGKSDYKWVIDPLDGTHNYIHRFPLFGVSIALEYKGDVILGVIYLPTMRQMFTAEKGKGAFLNGRKILTSKLSEIRDSMVSMDSSFSNSKRVMLGTLSRLIDRGFRIRIPGSAVFELTSVAQGITSAHISYFTNPWDVAAGFLIITEAGGKITDFNGKSVNHYCREFVATNSILHDKILNCL